MIPVIPQARKMTTDLLIDEKGCVMVYLLRLMSLLTAVDRVIIASC